MSKNCTEFKFFEFEEFTGKIIFFKNTFSKNFMTFREFENLAVYISTDLFYN